MLVAEVFGYRAFSVVGSNTHKSCVLLVSSVSILSIFKSEFKSNLLTTLSALLFFTLSLYLSRVSKCSDHLQLNLKDHCIWYCVSTTAKLSKFLLQICQSYISISDTCYCSTYSWCYKSCWQPLLNEEIVKMHTVAYGGIIAICSVSKRMSPWHFGHGYWQSFHFPSLTNVEHVYFKISLSLTQKWADTLINGCMKPNTILVGLHIQKAKIFICICHPHR